MTLAVKKFDPSALLPKKANPGDAAFDLFSNEDCAINPHSFSAPIGTGIGFTVPEGTYGRIAPRSGLAAKNGISVNAGVVDRSYTGEVKVLLVNNSNTYFSIRKGDRIAQLILEKIVDTCDVVEVDNLQETQRNDGGFGSTGR